MLWKALLLLAAGARAAAGPSSPLRIHLVPHTHDDPGWLKTVDQYFTGSHPEIQVAGVRFILDGVVQCLLDDPTRKFTFAEVAFFARWWRQQPDDMKHKVRELVRRGQLSFVNGGWVQHDEASAHLVDMVDQTTRGHQFLAREFNYTPKVTWQIDPFGHSTTQATMLTWRAGFDAVFFARSDYNEMQLRRAAGAMEAVWRPACCTFGSTADVLAAVLPFHYSAPEGFSFEWGPNSAPQVQADPSLDGWNVQQRVDALLAAAARYSATSRGPDVLMPMGDDFTYASAGTWYKNMDVLISAIKKSGVADAFYSTPAEYVAAKAAYKGVWPLRLGDHFPYASSAHDYWTGYFSSRPTSKYFISQAGAFLNLARKVLSAHLLEGHCGVDLQEVFAAMDELEAATALCQHHDAVTGTARQAVANDYARRLHRGLTRLRPLLARMLSIAVFRLPRPKDAAAAPAGPCFMDAVKVATGRERVPRVRSTAVGGRLESTEAAEVGETSAAAPGDPGERAANARLLPELAACELGNVSLCRFSVQESLHCKPMMLLFLNSLAHGRLEGVTVPLARDDCAYAVVDSQGSALPAAVLPVPRPMLCLQHLLRSVNATEEPPAPFTLAFSLTDVPPVGYTSVFVSPQRPPGPLPPLPPGHPSLLPEPPSADAECPSAAASSPLHNPAAVSSICAAAVEADPALHATLPPEDLEDSPQGPAGGTVVIRNTDYTLRFDPLSGLLASVTHLASGLQTALLLDFTYFDAHSTGPTSDAYSMRPNTQVVLSWADGRSRPQLEVIRTAAVEEVRQRFSPWCSLVTRLWAAGGPPELQWLVGPVPVDDGVGKDVTLRIRSSIHSRDEFFTDSNGHHTVRRRRGQRPTWDLKHTEPVAANFYPTTNLAFIRGRTPGPAAAETTLAVFPDRPHGVASLESGGLHITLHRRLLQPGGHGVGEALNETMCGCRECACTGLVATGTIRLSVSPELPEPAMAWRGREALLPFYAHGADVLKWAAGVLGSRDSAGGKASATRAGSDRVEGGPVREMLQGSSAEDHHPLARAILQALGQPASGGTPTEAFLAVPPLAVVHSEQGDVDLCPSAAAAVAERSAPCALMRLSSSLLPLPPAPRPATAAVAGPTSPFPSQVQLITFMPWPQAQPEQLTFLVRLAAADVALTTPGSLCSDTHAQGAGQRCSSGSGLGGAGGTAAVDLCAIARWPLGQLRARELTLTGAQPVHQWVKQRTVFPAAAEPMCFKKESQQCESCEECASAGAPWQERGLGDGERVVDCTSDRLPVLLRAGDVRTFALSLPGSAT